MRILTVALALAFALPAAALACDREAAPTTASAAVPAAATLVTLRMESVTCGSCVVPIRRELTALAGVLNVASNEADVKEVVVSIEAGKVTTEQLVAAVKKAGYDAVVKGSVKNS